MKKLFAVLLSMILLVGCFAGCASQASDSDLEFVQNKGKLIVGITDYAPMDYKDDNGEWIGFDADLARLFAKELGVEIEFFVIADWSKKVFELDSKNIDVIWNGMTINDELKATTNCSKPYVLNAQVIITKADIAANYTTADSIKELTIAVENGSTGEDVLKDLGITDYVAVDTQSKAIMEVAAGTSEACIVDITAANAMTGEGTSYPELKVALSLNEEEYGVGFRKGSDITAKFNDFLAKCKEDGKLAELAAKYNLTLVDWLKS